MAILKPAVHAFRLRAEEVVSVSISRAVFGLWLMLASFAGQAQSWYMTAEDLHEAIHEGRCNLKDQKFSSTWPTGSTAAERAIIALQKVEGKDAFELAGEYNDIHCLWAMVGFTSTSYAHVALASIRWAEIKKESAAAALQAARGRGADRDLQAPSPTPDPKPTAPPVFAVEKDILVTWTSNKDETFILAKRPETIVVDVAIPARYMSFAWVKNETLTLDQSNGWKVPLHVFTDDRGKNKTAISVEVKPRGDYYTLTTAVVLQYKEKPIEEGEGAIASAGDDAGEWIDEGGWATASSSSLSVMVGGATKQGEFAGNVTVHAKSLYGLQVSINYTGTPGDFYISDAPTEELINSFTGDNKYYYTIYMKDGAKSRGDITVTATKGAITRSVSFPLRFAVGFEQLEEKERVTKTEDNINATKIDVRGQTIYKIMQPDGFHPGGATDVTEDISFLCADTECPSYVSVHCNLEFEFEVERDNAAIWGDGMSAGELIQPVEDNKKLTSTEWLGIDWSADRLAAPKNDDNPPLLSRVVKPDFGCTFYGDKEFWLEWTNSRTAD